MAHTFGKGVYLVTGASRGIGRAIAHALAARGADLILLARDKKALQQVQAECRKLNPSAKPELLVCDLANYRAIRNAAILVQKKYPELAGIINNAGYARPGYFAELPPQEFERAIKVDYLGSVWLTHSLHSLVKPGGIISFTSSVVGFMGVFGYSSYAGAKFALVGFAEVLRQELLSRQIQVSVLCPPDTDTPGYAEENKTKPPETRALSEKAKLLTAEAVAKKFVDGVERGKFIITCNFESALLYRLHGIWPGLVFRIMAGMIRRAQKKQA
ncbi:MAG: SDR family oxidoreductase [Turneriella sp.]|nr:SDR family oxidoreductase [Turneriella sp.]